MTSETTSLGEFLRHERERRGITIEQLASATKIGVRTLHALESDHFAELPAKPFVRGFIISYCRFIGLDHKEVLANFGDFITQKATERPTRDGGHSGYAFEKRDGEQQSRTFLFIAIFSFVLIGGGAVLLLKPSFHHRRNSHVEKLRATHPDPTASGLPAVSPLASPSPGAVAVTDSQPVPKTEVSPVPTPSAVPSTPDASNEAKAQPGEDPQDPLDSGHSIPAADVRQKVVFKILDDVWVRYQVDHRPVRKFIIRKGKSLVLKAQDSLFFQVSNPQLVSYAANGRESVLLSESKQLLERNSDATVIFPPELAKKPEFVIPPGKPLSQAPMSDPKPANP